MLDSTDLGKYKPDTSTNPRQVQTLDSTKLEWYKPWTIGQVPTLDNDKPWTVINPRQYKPGKVKTLDSTKQEWYKHTNPEH